MPNKTGTGPAMVRIKATCILFLHHSMYVYQAILAHRPCFIVVKFHAVVIMYLHNHEVLHHYDVICSPASPAILSL